MQVQLADLDRECSRTGERGHAGVQVRTYRGRFRARKRAPQTTHLVSSPTTPSAYCAQSACSGPYNAYLLRRRAAPVHDRGSASAQSANAETQRPARPPYSPARLIPPPALFPRPPSTPRIRSPRPARAAHAAYVRLSAGMSPARRRLRSSAFILNGTLRRVCVRALLRRSGLSSGSHLSRTRVAYTSSGRPLSPVAAATNAATAAAGPAPCVPHPRSHLALIRPRCPCGVAPQSVLRTGARGKCAATSSGRRSYHVPSLPPPPVGAAGAGTDAMVLGVDATGLAVTVVVAVAVLGPCDSPLSPLSRASPRLASPSSDCAHGHGSWGGIHRAEGPAGDRAAARVGLLIAITRTRPAHGSSCTRRAHARVGHTHV